MNPSTSSDDTAPGARRLFGVAVRRLADAAALIGGSILTGMTGLVVTSIVRRSLGFTPILGDFELVQWTLAVCVTLFLPRCQLQGANVVVDFFTAKVPRRPRRAMDAFGALLFALIIGVVTWRVGAGAVSLKQAGETTMLLGLPIWISYALMTPGLALTSAAALHMTWQAWAEARGE